MRITIPCTCDDEEHEEHIEVESSFGRTGFYGIHIGDALPCGRAIVQKDIDRIFESIKDASHNEP